MTTGLRHLSQGITQVIAAFESKDLSALQAAFGERGLAILNRWWSGEELGIARIVGDVRSPDGVLGEEAILRQARCAGFNSDIEVLDIACGIGGPSRVLARCFRCNVLGIDLDPDSIVVARCLSKLEGIDERTSFEIGDRISLPVDDGRFDIVWGHGGWGTGEDYRSTWAEAFRALRRGGQICCSGVSRRALGWIRDLGFSDVRFHEYYGELRRRTLKLFLRALNEQKQRIVEQTSEHVWTMFHDQKTRQLADLAGQDLGVVVAPK